MARLSSAPHGFSGERKDAEMVRAATSRAARATPYR